MKKNFLFLFISLCFLHAVSGKSRSIPEAKLLVSQFMNQSVKGMEKTSTDISSTLTLSYTSMDKEAPASGKAYYYIFNKGNDNGYIIISADDRTKTILGYTNEGNFDFSVLPVNVKEWLNFYENEIKSLPDSTLQTTMSKSHVIKKVNSTEEYLKPLAPLLGTISWNQNYPYNNQCPVINASTNEKAITGCVATGMAQVMKYYNWPKYGTGTGKYTISSLGISKQVNITGTQYDWSNMNNTYSRSSNSDQINAVATLMYNCGVAVSMDYGKSSSASVTNMALALINNFGYDSNLQIYNRDYYTRSEWTGMLNRELNSSRPVLFSGNSDNSGHLFVCDGYDLNGLYHFNWGWGGKSNGYYEISALDTENEGTYSSTIGFNNYQTIIVGLQKPVTNSSPTYLINTTQPLTCSSGSVLNTGSFTVTGNGIFNFGINSFTGDVGLALYDDKGLVQVLQSNPVSELESYYGWSEYPVITSIPAGTAGGIYKLYFVYKSSTENDWQIMRGKVGTANYLDIVVSNTSVKINSPGASETTLTLNSLNLIGNLYQNTTGRFSVSITNKGNEYNSILGIKLKSTANDSISQLVNSESVNIASGETRTLEFNGKIALDPGEYNVSVVYDSLNDNTTAEVFSQLGLSLPVTVLKVPTEEPALSLSGMISFPDSATVDNSDIVLSAKIKNSTGLFDNKLIVFAFPPSGGNSIAYFGYQNVILDSNEEETITFRGSLDLLPGNYQLGVYYLNSGGGWTNISPATYSYIPYTVAGNLTSGTGQFSTLSLEIYPNPVSDIINIRTDHPVKRIFITDLYGKQLKSFIPELNNLSSIDVNDLHSGTYLIKVQTENETKVDKFFKK